MLIILANFDLFSKPHFASNWCVHLQMAYKL